jgi:hypothetical protein
MAETENISYIVKKIPINRKYAFKLRAKNECGVDTNAFSPELDVSILFKPDQQQSPVNTIVDCSLRIDWPTPENGGSPILEYNVEI